MQNSSRSSNSRAKPDEFTRIVYEMGRGGRISIIASATGQVIRFGFQIMLSRVLGANAYGLYTLGRSMLEIMSRLSLVGLESGVMNFLAIFRGEGDTARIRGTILYSVAIVAIISSFIAFCLWLSASWIAEHFFKEPSLTQVLRGFAIVLPFDALLTLLAFCARGFRHMKYYNGMIDIIQPLGTFLCIAGAFWLGMRLDGVIWGFILSTGLAFFLMVYFIYKIFPKAFDFKNVFLFERRKILVYSAQMLCIDLSQLLLRHADRLILGYFGVAHEVGVYSVSNFVGTKLNFFQNGFSDIFAPLIADLHNRGKKNELARAFKTVSKWNLLLTLPVFFIFVFLGHHILALFGREFIEGTYILVVLSVAQLINIGVGPVGYMLIMTGRPVLQVINNWVIMGVMNILLNLWLVPQYGALGAALATGISIIMVNLIRLAEVYLIHRCHPFQLGTLKTLTAFAITGGVLWQLDHLYASKGWWAPVAIVLFILGYVGILALLGWDEEDQLIFDRLRYKVRGLMGSLGKAEGL